MASADEIRTSIGEGRAALKAALEAADGSKWEQVGSGNDEWSPRAIAEHVIGSESFFAGGIATTMQSNFTAGGDLELANPAEAMAALETAVAAADKVYRYVEDRDLEKAVGDNGGTIASMMGILAGHASEHAAELTASS